VALIFGLGAGIGAYTFVYAKGASYLGHDSAACANCHIMRGQYDAWLKGPHRVAAQCNDCHTPSPVVSKYAVKAGNGFWHSFAFTSGRYPEYLRIKPGNLAVTERRCRECHETIVSALEGEHRTGEPVTCVRCHSEVGHAD
jgi:cytochrome c nitrite reductase small subunit